MRRWVWVVVLMTVALMGYLMGLNDSPSPPPLPSDAGLATWWGIPISQLAQVGLLIAAVVILITTVWDLIKPRKPFKLTNPPRQTVARHRHPGNRYLGIHRR